jgi:hypothetical protein
MMGVFEETTMTQTSTQLRDVTYNASNQCFEALVTVQCAGASKTYPCSIEAPLTMSFEKAAEGLRKQALRRDEKSEGMYSQMQHRANVRAGRARFDVSGWLSQLGFGIFNKAA